MPFEKGHPAYNRRPPVEESEAPPADVSYVTFRRVVLPDLDDIGLWLLSRLRRNRPQLNDRTYVGWLRGCMESAEFKFIRSAGAVGMCQRVYGPMDAKILVKENFVFAREGGADEAAQMYRDFLQWAKFLGATEYVFGADSDVPPEKMEQYMGPLQSRSIVYARIKQ